jgi:hypothetical protein
MVVSSLIENGSNFSHPNIESAFEFLSSDFLRKCLVCGQCATTLLAHECQLCRRIAEPVELFCLQSWRVDIAFAAPPAKKQLGQSPGLAL